jgi:hypothetical protein
MSDEQNPTADPVDQADDVAALRSEAANRRRALRAMEAERDSLRERLDDRDRADVERLAAAQLADPGDLWLSTSLDELRGEDGLVDMDRARGQLERLLEQKPHWRKAEPKPMPDLHQGPRLPVEPAGPSFGKSVKRALRGG